jgi:hypothetical protein
MAPLLTWGVRVAYPPADQTPDEIYNDIMGVLLPCLDEFAPVRDINVRGDTPPLYLASDTCQAMRERDAAHAIGGTASHCYKHHRNCVVCLVKRDRLKGCADHLAAAENRTVAAWCLARDLLQPQARLPLINGTPNNGASAEAANNYFSEKVLQLRAKMPPKSPWASKKARGLSHSTAATFDLHCIGENVVKKHIRWLSSSQAVGHNGISSSEWKNLASLARPIMHLINASIKHGVVPCAFKKAVVHPIPKKGKDSTSAAGYRPVAILPAFRKVLELIVAAQLTRALEQCCQTQKMPIGQTSIKN